MRIISDSSCDILTLQDAEFAAVPLEIYTDERRFVDDDNIVVHELLDYLEKYNGRSYTACLGTQRWVDAFQDSEEIYVVTMTSGLSGQRTCGLLWRARRNDRWLRMHLRGEIWHSYVKPVFINLHKSL